MFGKKGFWRRIMGLLVFFLFVANGFGAGRETFVTFGCFCFFQVFVDFCVSKFFFQVWLLFKVWLLLRDFLFNHLRLLLVHSDDFSWEKTSCFLSQPEPVINHQNHRSSGFFCVL